MYGKVKGEECYVLGSENYVKNTSMDSEVKGEECRLLGPEKYTKYTSIDVTENNDVSEANKKYDEVKREEYRLPRSEEHN